MFSQFCPNPHGSGWRSSLAPYPPLGIFLAKALYGSQARWTLVLVLTGVLLSFIVAELKIM